VRIRVRLLLSIRNMSENGKLNGGRSKEDFTLMWGIWILRHLLRDLTRESSEI
jgi:hypothetical protein